MEVNEAGTKGSCSFVEPLVRQEQESLCISFNDHLLGQVHGE